MGWNKALFLALNAPASPDALLATGAELLANDVVFPVMALLVGLWVWGCVSGRAGLLATVGATLVDLGINQGLGWLWFEPRPFMAHLGHTLIAHAADNSFPSDHATFLWTIGFSLIATGTFPRWGLAVALSGFAVAWARIYVGVHFPVDMLASFLVAAVGAAIAASLQAPLRRLLLPWATRLYVAILQLLRLPPHLFPRR